MNEANIIESFETKRGHIVNLRLLRADDGPLLVDIFEHMSSTSRYLRFNQSVDNVSPERIRQEASTIAQSDLGKKLGVIAFADLPGEPNAPIGAARLVQTGAAQAEVALSVRDDMHGLGVGTTMLRKLACLARQNGYRELIASIRSDNPAVWKVFSRLPFEVIRTPAGSYADIIVDLTKPENSFAQPQLPSLS